VRRILSLAVVALLAAACGDEPASDVATTSSTGRMHTARTWFDARYAEGSTSVVVLTYLRPAGEGCDEQPVAVLQPTNTTDVRAEVRVEEPWAPATCDVVPAEIELDLGEPLGDRRLLTFGSDTAFVDRDGTLVLDPATTACGREDCSQPSPTPAPCSDEAAPDAVEGEIDGADPAETLVACDGSFLVVDLTVGASGCPPEQRADCARPQRAYFVARDGAWRLVTYAREMRCEQVFRATAIRFPASVCGGD
jgi:hypothetical protein